MSDTVLPNLVGLGDLQIVAPAFEKLKSACQINLFAYDQYALGDEFKVEPCAIICSQPPTNIPVLELAQTLRMTYPEASIYLIVQKREDFDPTQLSKNGFSDVFLWPTDEPVFLSTIMRQIATATKGALKVYREVQLVDIEPGVELGFDLYLHMPANNKYIKYVSSKDSLDKVKAQKLVKHHISSASISEHQVSDFYKFSADRLRSIGSNSTLSETEKIERQEKAVRTLLSGFFGKSVSTDTFESGRRMMQDCGEIVKSYIVGEKPNSWYERFLKVSSSANGTYNHASNVSSFASMLAIGLGLKNIEDIGLAALLHDIGVAELPNEVCIKKASDRTPEEKVIYQTHPQKSVDMIKSKKMIVSEMVMKIILQHHENYDGSGYPNKLAGDRICVEAQILRLADEIEKVLTETSANSRTNAAEVIKNILKENATRTQNQIIAPDLAVRILNLLGG